MGTLEHLTIHVFLSNDVVKELCVVGVHPPTSWTGHHLLLGVATQVLSKLRAPFNCGFTIFPFTAYSRFPLTWWNIN